VIHYVAIVEHEPGKAIGIWFPDVPGCFSAGDTLDEALRLAPEALHAHAEALIDRGFEMPCPRTPDQLLLDPEAAKEMAEYMVALIPFEAPRLRQAAE
jgi:predicted RNase H-like HicB family nuclease